MEKRTLFSLLFSIIVFVSFSQGQSLLPRKNFPDSKNPNWVVTGWQQVDSGYIGAVRDTNFTPRFAATHITWLHAGVDTTDWLWTGTKWAKAGGNGFNDYFNATTPSTSPVQGIAGVTYGTTTIGSTLNALLYPSQPPQGTISGGFTQELMAAGANLTYTLNWTASRQAATALLQSVNVAGNFQTFVQPNAPGTVSGTQSVSFPRNQNITYSNVVTTTDNKTDTKTTTFAFLPKRYWGTTPSATPTDAQIIAVSSELSSNPELSQRNIAGVVGNYIVYAYPANEGALTKIKVNGFDNFSNFTATTRSFTNASGYTQSYYIYTTSTPLITTDAFTFETSQQ